MKPTIIGTKSNLAKIKPSNPKLLLQLNNGLNKGYEVHETDDFNVVVIPQVNRPSINSLYLTKLQWEDVIEYGIMNNDDFKEYSIISDNTIRHTENIKKILESL